MKTSRPTPLMCLVALAFTAIMTLPSHAAKIVDTFYGDVLASDISGDVTTLDTLGLFGPAGKSLVGDKFIFTLTILTPETDPFGGQIQGGAYYNGSNPISSTLKIGPSSDNYTQIAALSKKGPTGYNSGDADFSNGPDGTIDVQEFQYLNQLQTYYIDISLGGFASSNLNFLGKKLPALQASNGDFLDAGDYTTYADFSDGPENVALQIESINALPTPEPSSLMLLGTGLLGLGALARRKLCI